MLRLKSAITMPAWRRAIVRIKSKCASDKRRRDQRRHQGGVGVTSSGAAARTRRSARRSKAISERAGRHHRGVPPVMSTAETGLGSFFLLSGASRWPSARCSPASACRSVETVDVDNNEQVIRLRDQSGEERIAPPALGVRRRADAVAGDRNDVEYFVDEQSNQSILNRHDDSRMIGGDRRCGLSEPQAKVADRNDAAAQIEDAADRLRRPGNWE